MTPQPQPTQGASRQRYLLSLLATALMIVLVVLPANDLPPLPLWNADKILHCFLFAAWTTAVLIDTPWLREHLWAMVALALTFSLSTELLQLTTSTRAFEVGDLMADAVGVIVVVVAFRLQLGPPQDRQANFAAAMAGQPYLR